MKVFILECEPFDYGSSSFTVGVYSTLEKAQAKRAKLETEQLTPDETGYVSPCLDTYSIDIREVE